MKEESKILPVSRGNHLPYLYIVRKKTGCWEYLGSIMQGYGQVRRTYERITRTLVPDGLTLDHLCKNTVCVNPKHLEIVSITENARRGKHVKLGMKQAREIRQLIKQRKTHEEIAKMYGVSTSSISYINSRKTWREEERPHRMPKVKSIPKVWRAAYKYLIEA